MPLAGFAEGGFVQPVAASTFAQDTASSEQPPVSRIFVVPDLASAEDLAADIEGKVEIRVQNAIRRFRA